MRMSEEDQVQTTTSNTNATTLNTLYNLDKKPILLLFVAVKQQSETNDRHLQDGEFEMLKA